MRCKHIEYGHRGEVKYVGYLKDTDKLGDEIVELDKVLHPEYTVVGRHAIPIKNIGSFNIVGRLYRCNIVGSHIVVSSRYPLMYLNVEYERPMVSGSLFQIFFSIDMNKDEKKQIKELRNYVNLSFTGSWKRHIDCDDEFTQNYDDYLVEMLENDAITYFCNSEDPDIVAIRNSGNDDNMTNWIDTYVAKERVYYDNFMKEQVFEFKNMNKVRDDFIEMCTSDRFHKFLQLSMKARELHRRKEYGLEEDTPSYVIPKSVIKLNDIQQMLIDNDEFVYE